MPDRGLPSVDGSSACPFVAFEDDRDERADRPDHRHRCFAEAVPAPRALAHQEAYCLSSAFPVCPTFQEWARREAAQARPGAAVSSEAVAESSSEASEGATGEAYDADDAADDHEAGDADDADDQEDLWGGGPQVPIADRPRRNPPRDWAAPPPWAAGGAVAAGSAAYAAAGAPSAGADDVGETIPEEGRGLAGSPADRLARGADPDDAWLGLQGARPRSTGPEEAGPSAPADPELAGLVGRRPAGSTGGHGDAGLDADDVPAAKPGRRPTVSSTRDRSRDRDRERDRERQRAEQERAEHDGPAWEQVRRYEAYPSIKARAGLPSAPQVPRLAVLAGALGIAALLLFFLPTVLNIGGRGGAPAGASGSLSAAPSVSLAPTPVPDPTPQIYTIKAGDTLTRIARKNGLTLEQLLEANKDTITNANKIKVGDKIVIPTPPPDEVTGGEASPSAT